MNHSSRLLLAVLACASFGLGAAACSGDDNTTPGTGTVTDAGTKDTSTPVPVTDAGADTNVPQPGTDGGADTGTPLPTGMIDRMGRPAINTALNYGDDTAKDSFNHTETFAGAALSTWAANFQKNLVFFDSLDGKNDWTPDAGAHPLAAPLNLDVLIVDTSKTCTSTNGYCEGGYLEIEAELLLGGAAHATCGGRTLPQDVIDTTLTLLVDKGAKLADGGAEIISDGVGAATKPPTRTFPYLAAPN